MASLNHMEFPQETSPSTTLIDHPSSSTDTPATTMVEDGFVAVPMARTEPSYFNFPPGYLGSQQPLQPATRELAPPCVPSAPSTFAQLVSRTNHPILPPTAEEEAARIRAMQRRSHRKKRIPVDSNGTRLPRYPPVEAVEGGGYKRGREMYTDQEFNDIFTLGVEMWKLKGKWETRRSNIRRCIARLQADLDGYADMENRELVVAYRRIPLEGLPEL